MNTKQQWIIETPSKQVRKRLKTQNYEFNLWVQSEFGISIKFDRYKIPNALIYESGVENNLDKMFLLNTLFQMMDKLDITVQKVLFCRYWLDMSLEDTSMFIHKSIERTRILQANGIRELRKLTRLKMFNIKEFLPVFEV